MEYLSKNSIMHGDLAARNILLSIQNCGNESKLVAKIADFGLAKHFRDNMTYTKALRKYLPWKWMVRYLLISLKYYLNELPSVSKVL